MPLPNFLIIGANKSGTSSLHEYLNQHPQIFMSSVKEPTYFAAMGRNKESLTSGELEAMKSVTTTFSDYKKLFDNSETYTAIGESSTAYLANPHCSELIRQTLPDAKLVAILRHPIERAFSNYRMYRRWGFESRSFSRAIRDEMAGKIGNLPQGQHYLALGLYCAQLRPYLQTFGASRIRVYFFEQLQADAPSLLKDICRFLEVEDDFEFQTVTKHNADAIKPALSWAINVGLWDKDRLQEKDSTLLSEFYYEDISKLANLLEISTANWLGRYKK